VRLTPRAVDYLAPQRKAARAIERRLHAKIGRERTESIYAVLEALGGAEEMRMRDYLRKMGIREVTDRLVAQRGGGSAPARTSA
jgi:hypothetical protein